MVSKPPFSFLNSKFVPSIPCAECGSNTYCVRRFPDGLDEHQTFQCVECGFQTKRTTGLRASDADIQRASETLSGRLQALRQKGSH